MRSLELLIDAGVTASSRVIDVGGGDSTLVDALVERQLGHVTVLDISEAALARARARLGARASEVTWIHADITEATLPAQAYDAWHDRAVFHFLIAQEHRDRYLEQARSAIRPGGALIIATFALEGPPRCSGLDVARYSVDSLASAFANGFELERGFGDVHRTPSGSEQHFTYALMRRVAPQVTGARLDVER